MSDSAPERQRVVVAWFMHKDPGKSGTRKPIGGSAELYVEKFFAAYFNVPTVEVSEQTEAKGILKQVAAYTSTDRAGLLFTEDGTAKQVEGYVSAKDLVIKRTPAGKRIIIPSQETRTVTGKSNKKYVVSKTASCTVPRFFNSFMCQQLMGCLLRTNEPSQMKIAGKRYRWKKFPTGRFTDPEGSILAEAGAWCLTTEFDATRDLPFVDADRIREPYIMNM
ncbi:hypothetical protein PJF56_18225 [Roseofilum sp. BLCC_M91]|uniref:Uncharacterized protein n=1 Tax=Roseofilum halophilum BLCC-M91 TaxID=3022259 RepID=A0ABT7BNZ7_9CYAN|nr:hypothetical protein [Roseofilum halophilum]MDJ1180800.1 hypothetical protein [Roseofilum halophilum BLCC-M91]